jgi:curved DNA-binding protein CbpA
MARFTPKERQALEAMGLGPETDLHGLRKRYSTLVRRYHPDRNGGDRSHEARLQRVVESYQLLRKAAAFA